MAEQGRDAAADGRARTEQDEKKESEHGGRQNHGKRGQGFKRSEPAAAAQHEQRCERHGNGEENRRGDRGQTERKCEGLPVHCVHQQSTVRVRGCPTISRRGRVKKRKE